MVATMTRRKPARGRPRPHRIWSHRKFSAIWDDRRDSGTLDLPGMAQAVECKSVTTLYSFKNGKTVPNANQMFALAAHLDVHLDALTE